MDGYNVSESILKRLVISKRNFRLHINNLNRNILRSNKISF